MQLYTVFISVMLLIMISFLFGQVVIFINRSRSPRQQWVFDPLQQQQQQQQQPPNGQPPTLNLSLTTITPTNSPTTLSLSSPLDLVTQLHLDNYLHLPNKSNEVMIDLLPQNTSLSPLLFHGVHLLVYPAPAFPNAFITPLPALPSSAESYNTYHLNLQTQKVEIRGPPALRTLPLDVMLRNSTSGCIASIRISLLNHNIQILRGAYQLLSSPCGPCLVTFHHQGPDRTVFSFLEKTGFSLGREFQGVAYFSKKGERCQWISSYFNQFKPFR